MFKSLVLSVTILVSSCILTVDDPGPYYPSCGYVDGVCDIGCEIREDPDCMYYDPSCEGYYGYCEDYDGYCDIELFCCYYDSDC